jgi:ribose transport system substrate-binding protein
VTTPSNAATTEPVSGSAAPSAGSASSDAAGVAEAKSLVAKYEQEVSWQLGDAASFDGSKLNGKKVFWITVLASIPFVQATFGGFKEAAAATGVQYTYFDGKGDVGTQSRGLDTAVSQKPDAIVLEDIATATVKSGMDAAKAAGIPVIEAFNADAGAPPTTGSTASVSLCYSCAGTMQADYAIAASNGNVNAVIFTAPPSGTGFEDIGTAQTNAIVAEFKRLCPNTCKYKIDQVLIADWATKLPVLTQTAIQDQSVNWLLPLYDGETTYTDPAIAAAGAQSRIQVATLNASKGIVELLKKPGEVLAADVGSPNAWTGWAIADQTFRVMAGAPPLADEKVSLRLFDRQNAPSIDFTQPELNWYGASTDFRSLYKKLWGVQ